MKFNVNKCKVMHYGFNNPSYQYLMNSEVLIDSEEEIDLGVTIHKSLTLLRTSGGIRRPRTHRHADERRQLPPYDKLAFSDHLPSIVSAAVL